MARATTTVLLVLSCAAKASAFAPERAPVDLAGFTHLAALGIAAPQQQRLLDTAAWFGAYEAPSLQSKTIPSLPDTLPTGTTADTSKCFPLLNASSPLVGVFDCQLKCSYCVELGPTGKVLGSNATCVEIASGKAATAKGGPNVTTTMYAAFENMTVSVLGGNATHADCNCALVEVQGPVGCTYRMATCSYLVLPQEGKPLELLSRATAWSVADLAGPSARSPGYENPLAGAHLSPPSGSYEKEAYTLAAQAFQARPDAELLGKLGVSDTAVAEFEYLANEADLAEFAAPGCDTLITYGVGLPTASSLVFADQDVSKHLSPPTSIMFEDGDGLVPRRSPLRSHNWAAAHAAMRKTLAHREYPRQLHAQCIGKPKVISGGSPHNFKAAAPPENEGECYRGVLEYFMRYA